MHLEKNIYLPLPDKKFGKMKEEELKVLVWQAIGVVWLLYARNIASKVNDVKTDEIYLNFIKDVRETIYSE